MTRERRTALVVAAGLALAACAGPRTRVTWRAGRDVAPLPPDARVTLYVRSSASDLLRDALVAQGAEPVAAFPPGARLAEMEALEAPWLSWGDILDAVRRTARAEGADTAVATGGLRGDALDGILYFQLLRSDLAEE